MKPLWQTRLKRVSVSLLKSIWEKEKSLTKQPEHQQHTWIVGGGGRRWITDLFFRVCEAAAPRSGSRRAEIHPVVLGLSAEHTRYVALEIFPMSLLSTLSLSLPLCVSACVFHCDTHTTQELQLEKTPADMDPLYEWAGIQKGTHACTRSVTERQCLMTGTEFFFFFFCFSVEKRGCSALSNPIPFLCLSPPTLLSAAHHFAILFKIQWAHIPPQLTGCLMVSLKRLNALKTAYI